MTKSYLLSGMSALTALALLVVTPGAAWAQIGPSPVGGAGGPGGPPQPDDKPKGIAEKAPTQPGMLPTTPILPAPKSKKKKFELFEINGYFRLRGDWMKNLNQGFIDDPTLGGAPYQRPLGCIGTGDANAPCGDSMKSTNIRLRLEPVINIDENSSVHFQIDILDNLVLGSTPDGSFGDGTPAPTNIPVDAFSGSQVPPERGRNSISDSIRVKRAWAEVMTPVGLLKFGRQPSHWGLGLLANAGGADPFRGTYDLDSDYGDTADRVIFGTMIPGTDLRIAFGTDWASTKPSAAQSDIYRNRYDGQPFDLEDEDDVSQWLLVLAHLNSPDDFKDLVEQGETALNYGTYLVYRTQNWDYNPSLPQSGAPVGSGFVRRGAKAYIPDVWLRLGHKKFEFEAEAVAIVGSIDQLDDFSSSIDGKLDIRQFGAVARVGYKLVDDKLRLGLEVGTASGDQWDNSPQGVTNIRSARAVPCVDIPPGSPCNDTTVSQFRFDFDYKIDLILYRELLGTVTNATYIRPTVSYQLTKSIKFKGQSVISFANVPIATPGNGSMYGIEFDGDLGYENEGFFAGISYGILFPLSALDHPADDGTGPGFGYGPGNIGDAGTAQTVQTRLVLKF